MTRVIVRGPKKLTTICHFSSPARHLHVPDAPTRHPRIASSVCRRRRAQRPVLGEADTHKHTRAFPSRAPPFHAHHGHRRHTPGPCAGPRRRPRRRRRRTEAGPGQVRRHQALVARALQALAVGHAHRPRHAAARHTGHHQRVAVLGGRPRRGGRDCWCCRAARRGGGARVDAVCAVGRQGVWERLVAWERVECVLAGEKCTGRSADLWFLTSPPPPPNPLPSHPRPASNPSNWPPASAPSYWPPCTPPCGPRP